MSDKIKCSIEVDVDSTLKVNVARTITVDSYSKIEVEVPAAGAVNVSLSDDLENLEFFLLSASAYGTTITMGDGTDTINLEGPLLLFGGEIGANLDTPTFGDTLSFANTGGSAVSILIIIGQNVISAP